MKKRTNPLPLLDGVKPSYLVLPHEKQFYGLPLLHFFMHSFSLCRRRKLAAAAEQRFLWWARMACRLMKILCSNPARRCFITVKPAVRASRVFRLMKRFYILTSIYLWWTNRIFCPSSPAADFAGNAAHAPASAA